MKKPNNEIKAMFFAQYAGQEVAYYSIIETLQVVDYELKTVNAQVLEEINDFDYLQLKPLESITVKDLKGIGFDNIGDKKVTFSFDNYTYHWKSSCGNYGTLLLKNIDYLRSKGYALPFRQYSVDDLLKFKWIKLTN